MLFWTLPTASLILLKAICEQIKVLYNANASLLNLRKGQRTNMKSRDAEEKNEYLELWVYETSATGSPCPSLAWASSGSSPSAPTAAANGQHSSLAKCRV